MRKLFDAHIDSVIKIAERQKDGSLAVKKLLVTDETECLLLGRDIPNNLVESQDVIMLKDEVFYPSSITGGLDSVIEEVKEKKKTFCGKNNAIVGELLAKLMIAKNNRLVSRQRQPKFSIPKADAAATIMPIKELV